MNEYDKQSIRKALGAAKKHLLTSDEIEAGEIPNFGQGKAKYICYAISNAERCEKITREEEDLAVEYISNLLGKFAFVETFLSNRLGKQFDEMGEFTRKKLVQDYRFRWLDALIKELE